MVENPILIFSGSLIKIIHSNGSEETQQPTQLYRAGKVISLLKNSFSTYFLSFNLFFLQKCKWCLHVLFIRPLLDKGKFLQTPQPLEFTL